MALKFIITYKHFKIALSFTYSYLTKTVPPISAGIAKPIKVSTVGAKSAKIPQFKVCVFLFSTKISGTKFFE